MSVVVTWTSTPSLLPDREEGGRERLVAVPEDRVDGRRQLDGRHQAGSLEEGERLVRGQERPPSAGVVAEDPGRQDARRGHGKPAERRPDEVLAARHARESAPERDVLPEGALRVEEREVRALLRRLDEPRAEARVAEDRVEVLRGEVARELDVAGAQARADRGRAHPGPELDRVEPRGLLPVVGIALEDDAVRGAARDDKGSRADRRLAAVFGGDDLHDRRQDVREEGGEDRQRLDEFELEAVVRLGADARDVRGLALAVGLGPPDRGERRGNASGRTRTARSREVLTAAAVRGEPSEKRTPFRSRSRAERPPSPSDHSSPRAGTSWPSASVVRSVSKTVERISVSSTMWRIAGSVAVIGFVIATTSRPPDAMTSAAFFVSPPSRSSWDAVGGRARVVAAQVRDGRREREEPGQVEGVVRGGRGLDAPFDESPRLVHLAGVPRGLGGEQDRLDGARRLFLVVEDLRGRLGLAQRVRRRGPTCATPARGGAAPRPPAPSRPPTPRPRGSRGPSSPTRAASSGLKASSAFFASFRL